MRSEVRRLLGPMAALCALIATLASGCGDEPRPFRVGVIVDCVGINRSLGNAELSGAQLPLIERGAHARGRRANQGLDAVSVAGRPVELVRSCSEVYEFSTLITEVRRLAELEHVDAIVAGGGAAEAVALREVARREPGVMVLPVVHGPREATLRRPARNLFRVGGDHGQGVAGLGTYAFRKLGWRRAGVVLSGWDAGWGARDAFVAEFCAAGGRVSKQLTVDSFDPEGGDVARVPRDVDGVAVFAPRFFGPEAFLKRLARRMDRPAREIVAGPGLMDDPTLIRSAGRGFAGVTGSSYVRPERLQAYLRSYEKAFPDTSRDVASGELVTGYRDAVEALMQALERAGGNSRRVPRELTRLRLELLGGPIRLDHNRQAIVSTSLVRLGSTGGDHTQPSLTAVKEIPAVDASIGGLLSPSLSPRYGSAECRRGQAAPPWARRSAGG